jgi:hypothetical protein
MDALGADILLVIITIHTSPSNISAFECLSYRFLIQ